MSESIDKEAREREAREWLDKQPHCAGYPTCDGDLEGEDHSKSCPFFGKKQPSLYELLAAFAQSCVERLGNIETLARGVDIGFQTAQLNQQEQQLRWWFDEREAKVIDELAAKKDLSRQAVLRQALRTYQLVAEEVFDLVERNPTPKLAPESSVERESKEPPRANAHDPNVNTGPTYDQLKRAPDHLHIYNLRGFCWCGTHRDDWLRDEDMLEKIGEAFKHLNGTREDRNG